jgi:putative isomerase
MERKIFLGFDTLQSKEDFARINTLMQNGIQMEDGTKKSYFTGYEYKTLYDWDQYFEAIVQLYLGWDTLYIENGVSIFLNYLQEDGFIARTVPKRLEEEEATEHVKPFLAQIALLVHKRKGNIEWLEQNGYEKMRKYLLYWLECKDKNKNNLSTWDSAPHSGMDNQHERAGWWKDCFCEGVDLNCFLYRECIAFAEVANIFGNENDNELFVHYSEKIKEAIQRLCWDDETGFFYDRNEKTGDMIIVKSSAGFTPLWAKIATASQAARMISEHLLNPLEFWRPFPVPSYSADGKGYSEDYLQDDLGCSWRANTWIPVNYYIMHGLMNYGYREIAGILAEKSYHLVKKIGDREYYTSESGRGCGLDPFWGWSLLAYFMPFEACYGYDPTDLGKSIFDNMKIMTI